MDLQNKNWFLVWLVMLLLCFLAVAELYPEPSFRIMAGELQRLETIFQTSETNRQNWQLQANKLQIQAQKLSRESTTLQAQLKAERETTQDLRKSFEKLENDRLIEIGNLQKDKTKLTGERDKARKTRDIYGIILLIEIIGAIGAIVWKFKRFLPF